MYHIIVNPASRSGKGLKIWREMVEPMLARGGVSYRPYLSERAGDIAKIASRILSQAAAFPVTLIVLGGDGTVNEALQGIPDTSRVILGYIPTGSSNDLARDLGLPTDPIAALDVILHSGTACPMDLGTVTYADGGSRRFAVSCGIGFDAAVCEEALRSRAKNALNKIGAGKLSYLTIALKQILAAEAVSARLVLDGRESVEIGSILFTACMLHRFEGGGFMFSPDADATDGILNLCVVGDIPKSLILQALPSAFKGEHYRYDGINAYQAKEVRIETSLPLWVHTDGEVTRRSRSIAITCEQNALRVIKGQA